MGHTIGFNEKIIRLERKVDEETADCILQQLEAEVNSLLEA